MGGGLNFDSQFPDEEMSGQTSEHHAIQFYREQIMYTEQQIGHIEQIFLILKEFSDARERWINESLNKDEREAVEKDLRMLQMELTRHEIIDAEGNELVDFSQLAEQRKTLLETHN